MKPEASRENGFALVELLVSLALLALMVTYTVSSIFTLRQLNRISEQAAAQDEVDAVTRYLRQDIGDLRLMFETRQNGAQTLIFEGAPHSLTFIGSSDGARETGGLHQVRMYLNDAGNLIAERQLLQTQPVGPINSVVLLRHVGSLQFAYTGPAGLRSRTGWLESWPRGNASPVALRIVVEFKPGDSRRWPGTLVPIRAAR